MDEELAKQKNTMKQMKYTAPELDILTISVERGFAASNGTEQMEDVDGPAWN